MPTKLHSLLVGASLGALLPVSALAGLNLLGGVELTDGGEIVSFDSASGTVAATNSSAAGHYVQLYSLGSNGALSAGVSVNLNDVFGASATNSVTSVLLDSRGFGVATLVPNGASAGVPVEGPGKIAFFDRATGAVLRTLDVGYHPDSISITPDGARLLVANEGENVAGEDNTNARPGSVSVVNLAGVTSAAQLPALTSAAVTTHDFATSLASGLTLDGLRNNRLDTLATKTADYRDVEPEYITATNTKAYVTLQENNAIAVLDLEAGQYTALHKLGTIAQTIDASDRDGAGNTASIAINDTVAGMPMPDTIAKFQRDGATYLVTANEGDTRVDNADRVRGASAGVDTVNSGAGDVAYAGSVGNTGIGRLYLSAIDGNADADAAIDTPVMFGTRSFSIWDAATGALVFDSGSMIEAYIAAHDPSLFNIDKNPAIGGVDSRSTSKGPEPEALAYASFNGRDYVFVGSERENGIFQFDITNLNDVSVVGYFNLTSGATVGAVGPSPDYASPESILFVAAADNPTGKNILVVGYEGEPGLLGGSIAIIEVTAIPEPSSAAALVGAGALGLAAWRRRAAR